MNWLIIIVVLIALAALLIQSRKPHAVSSQQFIDTLERAITKKIDAREWDTFVHIPIGTDPYLDSLRQRLLLLETKQNSEGAEDGAIYDSKAMEQVVAILDELRSKKNGA